MLNFKSFFKHKFVTISLCLIFLGLAVFAILTIIPKSKTYTSLIESEILGKKVEYKLKFLDSDTLKRYYETEDGAIGSEEEFSYEIKNKTLYIEDNKVGKIDAFGIYIYSVEVNSQKINTGYECKPAVYTKYASFGLMGLGSVMFILAAYVGLTKKKKV